MIICKRPAPQQTDRRTDKNGQEGKGEGGERGERGEKAGEEIVADGHTHGSIKGSTRGPCGPKVENRSTEHALQQYVHEKYQCAETKPTRKHCFGKYKHFCTAME